VKIITSTLGHRRDTQPYITLAPGAQAGGRTASYPAQRGLVEAGDIHGSQA
jgi:hypothetical protein